MTDISLIGLGAMGSALGRTLLKASHRVTPGYGVQSYGREDSAARGAWCERRYQRCGRRAGQSGSPDQHDKYVQRVLEDLYDDRPTVEATLKTKGRIQ